MRSIIESKFVNKKPLVFSKISQLLIIFLAYKYKMDHLRSDKSQDKNRNSMERTLEIYLRFKLKLKFIYSKKKKFTIIANKNITA
jgi:hypothetical protein